MLSEQKMDALNLYFKTNPEVLLVYLFGSQARGDASSLSDVDLGVFFRRTPSLDEQAQMVVDCGRVLDLETEKVDVVALNSAPPLLKYDAVSEGKLVYQAVSDDALNDFELRAMQECFDTEHLRRVQDLYLREKILGVPSGF
jgi:hypothetical protein